ncbi:hypothetical protein scyTo_0013860, partial [Scyliorhinus torazame]|nr:hypothetical protein [Scyliorhinus torazame]
MAQTSSSTEGTHRQSVRCQKKSDILRGSEFNRANCEGGCYELEGQRHTLNTFRYRELDFHHGHLKQEQGLFLVGTHGCSDFLR